MSKAQPKPSSTSLAAARSSSRLTGGPPYGTDVTAVQVADVLDRARRLIEERGWWDGTWGTTDGECPVTAISKVCGGPRRTSPEAIAAICREAGVGSIPRWNDASDAETVLLTLKLAAERVRREGLP